MNIICKNSMKSHQLPGKFFWQINFIKLPSFFSIQRFIFFLPAKLTCERYLVGLLNQTRRYWLGHHDAISYSLSFLVPYRILDEERCWLWEKLHQTLIMRNAILARSLEKLHSCCWHIKIPNNQTRSQGCCSTFHRNTNINCQAISICNHLQSTKKQGRKNQTKRPNSAQRQMAS